jgi:hypothetical protein
MANEQPEIKPAPESAPPKEVALPWYIALFRRAKSTIIAAPVSFISCVLVCTGILGGGIYWLVDHLYSAEVRGKDAALIQKDSEIQNVVQERDANVRQNGKLSKEIEQLKIYRGADQLPLKKTALILASQIRDFTKDWKDTDDPGVRYHNVKKYWERFGFRPSIVRDDLDQNGQHSDDFDKAINNYDKDYKDVRIIASELERLANNLP